MLKQWLVANISFRYFLGFNNVHNAFKPTQISRRLFATLNKATINQRIQALGLKRKLLPLDPDVLSERVDKVNTLDHDLDESTCLRVVHLSEKDFSLFWKLLDASRRQPAQPVDSAENKFQALSDLFHISKAQACALFVRYPFLLQSKMSTIKNKATLLLDGGFKDEDLMNDLWVLTNTSALLAERMKMMKSLGLCPLKTWMLRRDGDDLRRYSMNRERVRTVLAPHLDKASYLMQRLNLTEYQWDTFVRRHPSVLRVQVTKLKEIIDFLLNEGFTEEQIYRTPRVLCHSLATLRERLGCLREIGFDVSSLSTLCKNRRQFQELIMKKEDCNKKNI